MPLLSNHINRRWIICIVVLSLLNVWLFWPANLYFLNDDLLHVPLTDQHHFFQTNSVRPVHELLVRFDLWLYGKHAYGYHVTALLLHFIVCIQLFDLSLLIQMKWLNVEKQKALKAAFLTVVLFLIYAENSESLAWILGRAPILSAMFFLVTLRIFFKPNFNLFSYLIGSLFFAASLFSYEQSIFFPLALLCVAYSSINKLTRREQLKYIILLIITAIFYIITREIITSEVIGIYEGNHFLEWNIVTLGANFLRIALRLFLNPGSTNYFIVCGVLLLLLGSYIFLGIKKSVAVNRIAAIFFVSAVLLLIVPVLSLGVSIHSFESGRYLYLPSMFLIIGISIAAVHVYDVNYNYRRMCLALFVFITMYWLYGKVKAAENYHDASAYAKHTNETVLNHFNGTNDTLRIDSLYLSIHRLPVFRLGFKTGIKWLNENIDTNKIIVQHLVDDNVNVRDNIK